MHQVRLDIVEDRDYTVTSWEFIDPVGTNNMSNPDKVFNFEGQPFRGIHFSKNYGENTIRIGGGYGLYPTSGFNGFVSATMSDANGNFSQPVTLNVTLSALPEYLCINFDPAQGVRATRITINNSHVIDSNTNSLVIRLRDLGITTTSLSIVFNRINLPFNPLKITTFTPGLISSFTDRNIQSLTFASQLLDTSFNINPTVIEQYAKVSLIDRDELIANLASGANLAKDLKVMLYVDDILKYTYLTSVWKIKANNSQIDLECNDPSKKLENQQISALSISDRSLEGLLNIVFTFTGYTYEAIDEDTRIYISNFIIKNSFVTITTSLDLLKKLCVVGFLRVYWDKNIFKIARCY